MENLREIRRHIRAVKEIRHITKAMKMVATAGLKRAQDRVEAARPFAKKLSEVLIDIAPLVPKEEFPLLQPAEPDGVGILAVTSDRGLCGRFNEEIGYATLNLIETLEARGKLTLMVVGRMGRDFFRKEGFDIKEEYTRVTHRPTFGFAQRIANRIMELYNGGAFNHFYLVYSRFYSALEQRPRVFRLIPVAPPQTEATEKMKRGECIFAPSPHEILDHLLQRYLEASVYRALLESAASERAARMAAMSIATDNATKVIEELTLRYHQARQAGITRQIAEVVSGAEAVEEVLEGPW